jgi:hypothetical protein
MNSNGDLSILEEGHEIVFIILRFIPLGAVDSGPLTVSLLEVNGLVERLAADWHESIVLSFINDGAEAISNARSGGALVVINSIGNDLARNFGIRIQGKSCKFIFTVGDCVFLAAQYLDCNVIVLDSSV